MHILSRPAAEAAPLLVGTLLLVEGVGGIVIETEAYDRTDPASHSFRGPTLRNAAMFGPPCRAYIYRSYGMHWCLNLVCGTAGDGQAVLIRALHPTHGLDVMRARRSVTRDRLLCSGPGRLCQALAVTGALDGAALDAPPFELRQGVPPGTLTAGPRIGITKGADTPWRFGVAGSPFLSRPLGRP